MHLQRNDIGDDEIRIISAQENDKRTVNRPLPYLWIMVIAAVALVAALIVFLIYSSDTNEEDELTIEQVVETTPEEAEPAIAEIEESAFVAVRDTTVNGRTLRFLTPNHAVPTLVIGPDALSDSTAVMVAQAADVRADNGQIAGTYVLRGDLISRGEAKAGYCAIVNGEISIGVADATPMLEQAIESEGYFFRQYPLVVGGQIVENKPKGVALRKALGEVDGRICVILSKEKLSFHDFSQSLVDAGVRNAIYLVGSASLGSYIDSTGSRFKFGNDKCDLIENVNFIVWK